MRRHTSGVAVHRPLVPDSLGEALEPATQNAVVSVASVVGCVAAHSVTLATKKTKEYQDQDQVVLQGFSRW